MIVSPSTESILRRFVPHTRLTIVFFLAFSLLFVGAMRVVGQTNVMESDPLRARKLLIYDMIGAYAGFSNNMQGGSFVTACNCEFTGGAKTGFAAGLVYERLTRSRIVFGAMLGFESRSIDARFLETEGVTQRSPATSQEFIVPVTFRNIAEVSISMLSVSPFVKMTFFDVAYIRAGPSFGYIFSSGMKHTKELIDDSVRFPNGEVASVALTGSDTKSVVLEDGPMAEVNALQISAHLGAGLEFKIGKKFFLGPVVQYLIPFTAVSKRGTDFTVRAFQVFVEGRFIF